MVLPRAVAKGGHAAEARLVKQFAYGNTDTGGGVSGERPFWIDGSLRISANEQVAFLKRLHENRLGLSERTARLTKGIMIAEQRPEGILRAKTGACNPAGDGQVTLWYVGYVEKPAGVWYLALELGDKDFDRLLPSASARRARSCADLGIFPAPAPEAIDDRRSARSALAHVRRRLEDTRRSLRLGTQPGCPAPPRQPAAGVLGPELGHRRRVPAEVA